MHDRLRGDMRNARAVAVKGLIGSYVVTKEDTSDGES
jgi:hypothetical protein